ncbi:hypothetical protein [Lysobacter gummosus]
MASRCGICASTSKPGRGPRSGGKGPKPQGSRQETARLTSLSRKAGEGFG